MERPFPIMDINFDEGKTVKPLYALLEAAGYCMTEQELGIHPSNYRRRNCIFGFDLTSSHTPPGMCFEPTEMQQLEVVAQLRTAKAYALEMIIYAEYDAEMELQPNKKVVMHDNA